MTDTDKKIPYSQTQEWIDKRNARRRAKYQKDASFRALKRRADKQYYASNKSKGLMNGHAPYDAKRIKMQCRGRKLADSGKVLDCLTVSEMGMALGGFHESTMRKWINQSRFPPPTHKAKEGRFRYGVYLYDEALKLCDVMREHIKTSSYLRSDHTDTIQQFFDAVN